MLSLRLFSGVRQRLRLGSRPDAASGSGSITTALAAPSQRYFSMCASYMQAERLLLGRKMALDDFPGAGSVIVPVKVPSSFMVPSIKVAWWGTTLIWMRASPSLGVDLGCEWSERVHRTR